MFGLELLPTILVALGGAAAAITAFGVIWNKVIRPLWRALRRGEQVWESVNTIEPFQAEVRDFMEFVRHELSYNSGSSVKDMTRETNRLIQEHTSNADLHRPVQVNVNTDNNRQQ
ncbi:hypothetical protein OHS59_16195 [Streptomyces sp. NBC_00414]|uniref:hypothetical protein n=1 Tax=Streptomyces sp. NBC_00414 TaxID=2975739 RepID=UPI002E1EEC1C